MIPLLSQAAMRGPPAGAGGGDVREARDEVRDYIDCRVVGAHAAFLFLRGPPPRGLPPARYPQTTFLRSSTAGQGVISNCLKGGPSVSSAHCMH